MLPALLLLSALAPHAATPQAAAVGVVSFAAKTPPSVLRVNTVGRYAVVLTSGGKMEGASVTAPILVQRFSFGWQAVDVLNFRCRLDSHGLGPRVNALLMRGMPRPQDERACGDVVRDSGPAADVQAVRRLMRGPLVPAVAVYQDWALGHWYGAGGGETLYHKHGGRWTFVAGGGGAMSVAEMRRYGVPRAGWCKLEIYDARCR
jgi:hypothetical protein